MTERIGYLVPEFPTQTHAFFWREICALEKCGVDPVIISTRPPRTGVIPHSWAGAAIARTHYLTRLSFGDVFPAVPGALTATGAVFSGAVDPTDRRAFLRNVPFLAPLAGRLRAVAAAEDIQHIHVHSCANSAALAMLASRSGGPSYSLTLHGPLSDYGLGQRSKWRNASFGIVITRILKAQVEAELAGALPPLYVQPMGVDTNRFRRSTPYSAASPDNPIRVFSCGRLNRMKGHQHLIAAVAKLAVAGIDLRLAIAGEDELGGEGYRGELERLIRELGVGSRVTLLGSVSEGAILENILSSHIFVLASLSEPLGVAYMEAMSCELPVVGTDAGGVGELIESGRNGLLVEPNDPDQIAGAIRAIVEDPDLARRLGQAGRQTVVERFSSDRSAEVLIQALQEAKTGSDRQ